MNRMSFILTKEDYLGIAEENAVQKLAITPITEPTDGTQSHRSLYPKPLPQHLAVAESSGLRGCDGNSNVTPETAMS